MFKTGHPSQHSQLYRERVLKLFCTGGANLIAKLVALKKFPNGNWQNDSEVEIYVQAQPQDDEKDNLIQFATEAIVFVFTAAKWRPFKTIHWTGADALVDAIGCLEMCGSLFSRVFPLWLEAQGTRPNRSLVVPEHREPAPDDDAAADIVCELGVNGQPVDAISRARELNCQDRLTYSPHRSRALTSSCSD